jgi:hypothetical protein
VEYTELSAYRLHAGHVTEWTPTAPTDSWEDDPRPLSVNHEAHIREAVDDRDAGVDATRGDNWIGTAFRIHAAFNDDIFRRAMQAWIGRHEAYRTTGVLPSGTDDGYRRMTVPAEAVDVAANPLDHRLDATQVRAHLEHHFATEVSALRWPHLTAVTIVPDADDTEGSRQGAPWFTVVFAADHAVMDAYTQIVSIAEIRELYRAILEDRAPALPDTGSHVDFSRTERALADTIDADHPAVDRWRRYVTSGREDRAAMPRFPLPVEGPAAADTRQASASVLLLAAADAEAFGGICRQHGANQTAGLLAALKIAYARVRNDRIPGEVAPLRYVMPMHTRNSPDLALSAGWFVGLMPVEDPVDTAGTGELFSHAILTTKKATSENRDLVAYPFPRVAEIAGITEPPRFVISYVDTRHVPGAADWTAHDRTLRGRAYNNSDVYFWIVRNADGLNISMRYPGNPTALASIRSLVNEFYTVLHTVADTGDAYSVPFQDPRDQRDPRNPAQVLAPAQAV